MRADGLPERIDQVTASLSSRDAIGQHTLQLRALLREMGFASDIYYAQAAPGAENEGLPLSRLRPLGADRWILYQLSIGSPAGDAVAALGETTLVDYHNITPAELLWPWAPVVAEEVSWGRRQLEDLAPRTHFAVADSAYNEAELLEVGYHETRVVAPLVDFDQFAGRADRATTARLAAYRKRGGSDWLFVGKVSPHKGTHELVDALVLYRRLYDPAARLHLVGGPVSEDYRRAVLAYAAELEVADAVDMPGSVSHEELIAYYQQADVFVCASRHEGFCVPLVEAMHHELPVVAVEAGAVAETLGDAGLVGPRDPLWMAAAVHQVTSDEALRDALRRACAGRLSILRLDETRKQMAGALEEALELGPR